MKAAEASQRKFSSISIHVLGGGLGAKKGRCLEHASSSRSSPLLAYPWLCLCLINPPPPRGVPPDIAMQQTDYTNTTYQLVTTQTTTTCLDPHPSIPKTSHPIMQYKQQSSTKLTNKTSLI